MSDKKTTPATINTWDQLAEWTPKHLGPARVIDALPKPATPETGFFSQAYAASVGLAGAAGGMLFGALLGLFGLDGQKPRKIADHRQCPCNTGLQERGEG